MFPRHLFFLYSSDPTTLLDFLRRREPLIKNKTIRDSFHSKSSSWCPNMWTYEPRQNPSNQIQFQIINYKWWVFWSLSLLFPFSLSLLFKISLNSSLTKLLLFFHYFLLFFFCYQILNFLFPHPHFCALSVCVLLNYIYCFFFCWLIDCMSVVSLARTLSWQTHKN